jgi:hypothetical protein
MDLTGMEDQVSVLLDEMIDQQQKKVLTIARERLPHLTGDDILNPQDFPELMMDPIFNYEEGIASGLLAAQIAIRAQIFRKEPQIGNPILR